jgi:hypothetical protein
MIFFFKKFMQTFVQTFASLILAVIFVSSLRVQEKNRAEEEPKTLEKSLSK